MKASLSAGFILFAMLVVLSGQGIAQSASVKALEIKANDYFRAELYALALPELLKLDRLIANKAEIKYKIGLCYLNDASKKKALEYLQDAKELGFNSPGLDFNLARALHYNYKFDEALASLNHIRINIKDSLSAGKVRYNRIKELEQMCIYGLQYLKNPQEVIIKNLGPAINSQYPEIAPVISADESLLIFTTSRSVNVGGTIDLRTGVYFEDLYFALKANSGWSDARNMGPIINTTGHDASVALSPDGQTLLLYRFENIYESKLRGNNWSVPQLLPKTINSVFWESSASVSADGSILYFSSNKPGGKGGKDIYCSKKLLNGTWGEPRPLPGFVNTMFEEDAPFIHPDGATLYFSSNATGSMGGFDIFYSTFNDSTKTWSRPVNMGYPINSPDDDLDFVWSADGKRGYFSSVREEGFGAEDIYVLERKIKETPLILFTGITLDKDSLRPVETSIVVRDNESGMVIAAAESNSKSGKFTLVLKPGKNYGLTFTSLGYVPYSEHIFISDESTFSDINKEVLLQPIEPGTKTILKNIFFDTDQSVLRRESFSELDRFVLFLKENSRLKIEIRGYTDNLGDKQYNQLLSEARAKSIADYLIAKGIVADRLHTKGFGVDFPVADNKTESGRQLNRRIEFVIVE